MAACKLYQLRNCPCLCKHVPEGGAQLLVVLPPHTGMNLGGLLRHALTCAHTLVPCPVAQYGAHKLGSLRSHDPWFTVSRQRCSVSYITKGATQPHFTLVFCLMSENIARTEIQCETGTFVDGGWSVNATHL